LPGLPLPAVEGLGAEVAEPVGVPDRAERIGVHRVLVEVPVEIRSDEVGPKIVAHGCRN